MPLIMRIVRYQLEQNLLDQEEFVQDLNQCYMCHQKLDPVKKKKCGFCNMETCNNHLRKRRRKNKKFQRICDNCEDKTLFDNYMKLQLKAEQALATQIQIISLKHSQYEKQVVQRRQKQKDLIFKNQQIKNKQTKAMEKLKQEEEKIENNEKNLEKQELQLKQLQMYIQRLSSSIKQNYEEDYKILQIQNEKLAKDLINLDKRRNQVSKAMEKRQKEIEQAYEEWQKRQYLQKLQTDSQAQTNKKKDCVIY